MDEFYYLGMVVSTEIGEYMGKNIQPLMSQLTAKLVAWRSLPLSPVGRVKLLKMVYLPKFLYFFRNTPSHFPKSFFRRLEGLLVSFGPDSLLGWQREHCTFPYREEAYLSLTSKFTTEQQSWLRCAGGFPSPNKTQRIHWRRPPWTPMQP